MAGIYLEQDGILVNMDVEKFDSEDELQSLIEHHEQLLAGDQINRGSPRRFLLVRREAGIPSEATGSDRWSVDHLFIDQDAVPTVVEVKRSTDTRIRREVVGQMLDYAANVSVHWPEGRMRSEFERTCEATGQDPGQELLSLLRPSDESDQDELGAFWRQADANLRAGRMRLLFVADEIPVELQRIIEFLNERMTPTEVLGIEVRRFAGGGLRAMIPSVVGLTAAAKSTKRSSNDGLGYGDLAAEMGEAFAQAERVLDGWADRSGLVMRVAGKSRRYDLDGRTVVWLYPSYGKIDLIVKPIEAVADLADLRSVIEQLGGSNAGKYSSIPIAQITENWQSVESDVLASYLAAWRAVVALEATV